MIFSKGFFLILLRVVLIVILAFGIVYTYNETDLKVTPYMLGGLLLIITIELTWRLFQQERIWAQFLNSIEFEDFNRAYQYKTNNKELRDAYGIISTRLEEIKTDRAAEFRLLQTVLKHIGVAVICFEKSGKVLFANMSFNQLLHIDGVSDVKHLANHHRSLYEVLIQSPSNSTDWVIHGEDQQLAIRVEEFKLKGKPMKLASMTNIKSALELQELASYQKLLRVMTHEIMNSTTPILSLVRVVNHKLINGEKLNELSEKDQRNTAKSLTAIEERTDGVLQFVNAYKQINKTLEPKCSAVNSKALVSNIVDLLTFPDGLDFKVKDEFQGELWIDKQLIAQVLINLVKNAVEALSNDEEPMISLFIKQADANIEIIVQDNGSGVSPDKVKEIFVPFYTTKKSGSGIGLALSKNIAIAHGGSLVYIRENDATNFKLLIPQKV